MKTKEKKYSIPEIKVRELRVEKGFSLSSNYGDYGDAGQGSGYIDSDLEL